MTRIPDLEEQLVAAAGRRAHSRSWARGTRTVALAFAAAALLATGAVAAGTDLFRQIGTTTPTPRERQNDGLRYTADRTIVATGTAPVLGPWEMSITESDAGPCLGLQLLDEPGDGIGEGCGQMGEFNVGSTGNAEEKLIHGRAPERAAQVRITAVDGFQRTIDTFDGLPAVDGKFFAIPVPGDKLRGARITWLTSAGQSPQTSQRVPGSA